MTRVKDITYLKKKKDTIKYEDLIDLKYIIVCQKESGLNVYSHYITGDKHNSTLVSSYMTAIYSLGLEIFEMHNGLPITKIEFEDYFLMIVNAEESRTIIAMANKPNKKSLSTLVDLSKEIDLIYGSRIEQFRGKLNVFEDISIILERYIPLSILYPMRLSSQISSDITRNEEKIIGKAKKVMSLFQAPYIHVSSLLNTPIRREEISQIQLLIEKGIFIPVKK